MYFYDGVCCALSKAFGSKGGSSANYPSEPYPIEQQKQEKAKKEKEEKEALVAELYMRNMVRAGKNWKK